VGNGPTREENALAEENVIFPERQHGAVNRGKPDTQTQPLQLSLVDQTMNDIEDEDLKLELREVQIRRDSWTGSAGGLSENDATNNTKTMVPSDRIVTREASNC